MNESLTSTLSDGLDAVSDSPSMQLDPTDEQADDLIRKLVRTINGDRSACD